jgi:hypothetical protein
MWFDPALPSVRNESSPTQGGYEHYALISPHRGGSKPRRQFSGEIARPDLRLRRVRRPLPHPPSPRIPSRTAHPPTNLARVPTSSPCTRRLTQGALAVADSMPASTHERLPLNRLANLGAHLGSRLQSTRLFRRQPAHVYLQEAGTPNEEQHYHLLSQGQRSDPA